MAKNLSYTLTEEGLRFHLEASEIKPATPAATAPMSPFWGDDPERNSSLEPFSFLGSLHLQHREVRDSLERTERAFGEKSSHLNVLFLPTQECWSVRTELCNG
jgi:hypothetical protein